MKRSVLLIGTMIASTQVAGPARAEDKGIEQAYQMGKDVLELQREVKELHSLLEQMLELDRQRLELMTRALSGGGVVVSAGGTKSSATADAGHSSTPGTAESGPSTGNVSGKLRLPEGAPAGFVYVENVPGRLVHGRTIEIKQVDHQFEPRFAVIQQGTEIRFPNQDATYHNVFSRSGNANFDLGIYRAGEPAKTHVFTKPGVAEVFCNMHAGMSTQVLVVPNALYTKVNADGAFVLKDVPAGRRKIVAWSPKSEPVEQWVIVERGKAASVELDLGPAREKAHLDKNGRAYGSYK